MGKASQKSGDQEQAERFERTAREHGVELDEKKLAETLRRMAKRENPTDAQGRLPRDKSDPSGD